MKMTKVLLIIPLLALLPVWAQTKSVEPRDSPAGDVARAESLEPIESDKIMKGTIGWVVLSDTYKVKDPIRIYITRMAACLDGVRTSDESSVEYGANGFKPVRLSTDLMYLVLKCTGQDKVRYEVLVNDETGLKKYIKKRDRNLRFETWERTRSVCSRWVLTKRRTRYSDHREAKSRKVFRSR